MTTLLEEYKRNRGNLTYPAKHALSYARDYLEVVRLEKEHDIELDLLEEEESPFGQLESTEDAQQVIDSANAGNVFAWFCAKVTVKRYGAEATSYLGCCSYDSEEDFKKGGYYISMINECLAEIDQEINADQAGEH